MDPQRWDSIKTILSAALALSSAEQAAYLEEVCQGDPELRGYVEALLAVDTGAMAFLQESPVRLLERQEIPPLEGRLIGPYKILREIGRGGMGVVYLASRQDDVFVRKVALKILGRADEDFKRRRQEIQILASLEHPNIGRLYEGGQTDDGLLYFLMEYIDGPSITTYCATQGLSLRARLELFVKVCAAVEYAHQRLAVHLDLKPSNILVAAGGEPKLLDFGIAGLLDEPNGRGPEAALPTGRWMTRAYASPEQLAGRPVTVASDVYSLGVLLYELLTGCNPHLASRNEPPLPATEAYRRTKISSEMGWRAVSARYRRRGLPRDLDAIVLKATHEEPAERYASVEQLDRDLRQYLSGRPVAARDGGLPYLARKLLVRRWPWVATAAVFVLVISLFGLSQWRQSRELTGALLMANQEKEKFERTSEFLIGLFEISDPSEARGNSITAREILDRGAAQIRGRLRDQPEVRASFAHTMGVVYRNLGLYQRAAPLLEEAVSLRRRVQGESLEVAQSLAELATLLEQSGEYNRSEALFRESLRLHRKLLQPDDLRLADAVNLVGNALLHIRSDTAAAEPLLSEALAIRRRHLRPEDPKIANSLMSLAALQEKKGSAEAAEPLYREALSIHRRLHPGDHPDKANALHNLGFVLIARGQYREAETYLREALAIRQRVLGGNHPKVASTMNELALALYEQGDFAAAEPLMLEVLRTRRRILGDRHPDVAISLMSLSCLWQDQGRYAEAEAVSRQALELWRHLLGAEHPTVATAIENVATLLLLQGKSAEAKPLFLEVLRMRRKLLGEQHPDLAVTLDNLAAISRKQGQLEATEAFSRQSLDLRLRALGTDHPLVAHSFMSLSLALAARAKYPECEAAARQAVRILLKAHPEGHWTADVAQGSVARCLAGQKRFREAEPMLLGSYRRVVAALGPASPAARKVANFAVRMYQEWGRPGEAARFQAVVDGRGTRGISPSSR